MQEFDPRRQPARYAPRLLASAVGMAVLIAGWRVAASESHHPIRLVRTEPIVAAALRTRQAPQARPAARAVGPRVVEELAVAEGRISGSLYAAAAQAGAPPALVGEVAKLFAHKLDFKRDIRRGDRFRLVFRRTVNGAGQTVSTGDLLYAEVAAGRKQARFYRFRPRGASAAAFFDAAGKDIRNLLLPTPVNGARLTSGFGMRMHPLLGYTRMHKGIDLGAPTGTPVLAASDGVVEEARWSEGYGRWLKIRHQGAYETGYGHLSRWAVRPGQTVHRGQVVAYVGSSGESTGPHLHFELLVRGRNVDPRRAKVPQGTVLAGRELSAFKAEKAGIDRMLAQARDASIGTLARADAAGVTRIAMR